MSMNELISVIVPAYNVEEYIEKSIQSVVNQTYRNIEIIIVDDGSTDNTGILCDELCNRYNNIRVIHQSNRGLSVARNIGFDNSHGDWIAFLDSDDWVEPEMYETLLTIAKRNNTKISSCLSRNIIDGKSDQVVGIGDERLLTHNDIISGLLSGNIMRFEVWNKLWQRELIKDIRFIPGQVAEDVHFDRIAFEKAREIAHINTVLHNYLISRPGNTNSSFKPARLCIFNEFQVWKEKLENERDLKSACIISAIASNFAVDIYGNALKTNQPEEILNELQNYFSYFYDAGRKARMNIKRRIKLRMFKISPSTVKLY